MATITYYSIIGDFKPHCPGVPDYVAMHYTRKVVIDLCERAKVWKTPLAQVSLTEGVWQYTLTSPITQTEVSSIEDAQVFIQSAGRWKDLDVLSSDKAFLLFKSYPELQGFTWRGAWSVLTAYVAGDAVYDPNAVNNVYVCLTGNTGQALGQNTYWQPLQAGLGEPQAVNRVDELTFRVLPIPGGDSVYKVGLFCAVRPTITSTGFEGSIYAAFKRAIFHGVLYELMNLPGKPWTNDKKADSHGKQWEYFVREAKAKAAKGFSGGDLSVQQKPWA